MPTNDHTHMEVAAELGRWAITDYDFDTLLAELVQAISEQLQVEFSSFLELLSDGTVLFRAGLGWKTSLVGNTIIEMGAESAGGHVIRTLLPLTISDLRCDDRFQYSPLL